MKLFIFITLLLVVAGSCSDCDSDPDDICTLPIDPGNCWAYFIRYGFDTEQMQCVEFVYGGCLGNENNFETLEDCQDYCEAEPQ